MQGDMVGENNLDSGVRFLLDTTRIKALRIYLEDNEGENIFEWALVQFDFGFLLYQTKKI